MNFVRRKGDAGGSTLGIRYNFRDGFSELGYGGIGTYYFLTNRMALTPIGAFSIFPTGGNKRNIGINSGVALFGLSYFSIDFAASNYDGLNAKRMRLIEIQVIRPIAD